MTRTQSFLSILALTGTVALGTAAAAAQSSSAASGYCHKKFPAIREETLFSNQPVLKDPSEGDLLDFYGRCDYDPLGKTEIQVQRAAFRRDRMNSNDKD